MIVSTYSSREILLAKVPLDLRRIAQGLEVARHICRNLDVRIADVPLDSVKEVLNVRCKTIVLLNLAKELAEATLVGVGAV